MKKVINRFKVLSSGFSLVEVVFALFLVALGLVVFTASINLAGILKRTRYQNIAYHIALVRMETLRNMPFSNLPASAVFNVPEMSFLPGGNGQINAVDINSDLKQMQVLVVWIENGNSKSISLDSLFFRNGLNNL